MAFAEHGRLDNAAIYQYFPQLEVINLEILPPHIARYIRFPQCVHPTLSGTSPPQQ
jgi:hypothetical protein